jgi:hypothetical protein
MPNTTTLSQIELLSRAVHYILDRTKNESLGRTRLYKALLFADLENVKLTGQSFTGATYFANKHGPVPVEIGAAIELLEADDAVRESLSVYPNGRCLKDIKSTKQGDASCFSSDQLARLDSAIRYVLSMSAEKVSEISHDDLWSECSIGEPYSVKAAAIRPVPASPTTLAYAAKVFQSPTFKL